MLQSLIVAFEPKLQQRGRPFRQLGRADHLLCASRERFACLYDPRRRAFAYFK